jgi:alkanesulfonate monooxygenase SsuD/methylene tetrahydromethanopterin reductase-like flavin-dependent oxidoreductase (luciferase family)
LWAVDHLFWPHPLIECLTALSVAATATRHATVGSCVLQLPLRSTPAVAKQAASLQHLSGGRFVLGVGVGSHEGEYVAAGADFGRRGRTIDRAIGALRSLWAGDGGAYPQRPGPVPIPVWVGGSSPAARRRAARHGDGWIPLFVTPEDYARQLPEVLGGAEAAGRDPDALTPAVVVFVHVAEGGTRPDQRARARGTRWLSGLYGIPPRAFERHLVAGPAAACAERIGRFFEAGARHVVAMVADDAVTAHFAGLAGALGPAPARSADGSRSRHDLVEVTA